MGWLWQAALLLAVLLCSAVHGELVITPSDINTCSNSTTDTSLQISRVQTCASASVVGYGTGSAFSFSVSKAKILRAAASACGDAVGNSIGELCAGADPMATIFNLATTCSTALATLYTKAVTGNGVFDMSGKGMNGTITKQGKLEACGSSCSNSQGAAQAFAQAAACGIGKATDNCMAATTYIKTQAFTRAFVKSTSESWGKACTHTVGLAISGGETIAVSAAASIAQAMTVVAASACGNCPTCKCKQLPAAFSWSNAGNFSNAAATVAGGRVGLAHAIADATTNFCNSDGKMESARSHARTIMASYADLVMGALGAVRGFGYVVGADSWACGSSNLHADLQTVKDASAEVFADAAGTVFGSWCPKAAAKINQLKLLTNETLNHLVSKGAKHCTQQRGNGQSYDLATLLTTGNKPFVQNIADALTVAKSCGCRNVACLWCASGKNVMKQPPGAVGPQMRVSASTTDSTKSPASAADGAPKLTTAHKPQAITSPVLAAAAVMSDKTQLAAGSEQKPKLVGPKLPVPAAAAAAPAAATDAATAGSHKQAAATDAATASKHKQAAASKQAHKMIGPQLPAPVAAAAAEPRPVAAEAPAGTASRSQVQNPSGTLQEPTALAGAPAASAAATNPMADKAQTSSTITAQSVAPAAAAAAAESPQNTAAHEQLLNVAGSNPRPPSAAAASHKQAAGSNHTSKLIGPQLPNSVATATEQQPAATEVQMGEAANIQQAQSTSNASAFSPGAKSGLVKAQEPEYPTRTIPPATVVTAIQDPQMSASSDYLLTATTATPPNPAAATVGLHNQSVASNQRSTVIGPQLPTPAAAAAAAVGGGGTSMWPAVDTQLQKVIRPQRWEPAASLPSPTVEVPTQAAALGDHMRTSEPDQPTPAPNVQVEPQPPAPAQQQIPAVPEAQKGAPNDSPAAVAYQAKPFVGPQRPPVDHMQQR